MQRKVPAPRWRQGASAAMFGLLVWLLPPASAQDHGMAISGAWIREAPPGVAMLAGYFSVTNHGGEPLTLVGARSARFGAVELHESLIEDGVARMRPLARVEIAPGAGLEFAPGGRHLMLMHPVAAVRAGHCIPVTLVLDGGEEVEVKFEVRRE